MLGKILPHWKLENSITVEEAKEIVNAKKKDEKEKKSKEKQERGFGSQNNSERSSDRESRPKDKESKDRILGIGSNTVIKEVAKEPEFAVFASYCNPPKTPLTVSILREMVGYGVYHFTCLMAGCCLEVNYSDLLNAHYWRSVRDHQPPFVVCALCFRYKSVN